MEARVAVLEEIARSTKTAIDRLERRMDSIDQRMAADFRWMLGIMLGGFTTMLALMAHGFHWF